MARRKPIPLSSRPTVPRPEGLGWRWCLHCASWQRWRKPGDACDACYLARYEQGVTELARLNSVPIAAHYHAPEHWVTLRDQDSIEPFNSDWESYFERFGGVLYAEGPNGRRVPRSFEAFAQGRVLYLYTEWRVPVGHEVIEVVVGEGLDDHD